MRTLIFFFTVTCIGIVEAQSSTNPFKVDVFGNGGKTMVLIPGFACSSEVWSETIERYGEHYTCYALTMAGFADTPPQDNPDIEQWITSIAQWIRDNRLSDVTLIGHSLGGLMSLKLSAGNPDLIEKIVIVDALPCLPALQTPSFQANQNTDCSMILQQFTALDDNEFRQMQKRNATAMVQDTVHQKALVDWSLASDRKTMAEIYCQFSQTDLRATLAKITCPTLVMLEAPFTSMKSLTNQQYANLKNATIKYAPTGLHFIMYDAPQWYFAQLSTFLLD